MRLSTAKTLRAVAADLWRRKALPTAISIAVHAALIAVIATLAVTVAATDGPSLAPRLAEVEIAAASGLAAPRAAPVVPEPRPAADPAESAERIAALDAVRAARRAADTAAAIPPIPSTAAPAPPPPSLTPPTAAIAPGRAAAGTTAFAGLAPAEPAQRIAYVIDASGAMASSLSRVLENAADSIDRLQPTQRFQVFLFGATSDAAPATRTPPPEAGAEPDAKGWLRATRSNKAAVSEWFQTVTASGRSAPLEGLRAAIAIEPDLIFLLSRSIQRSGPEAQWGAGRAATLSELEALNPLNQSTGARPAIIKTIQFIDEDPTGMMELIGNAHGDGAGSYRLLTFEDLGREQPPPPAIATPPADTAAIARAAAALRTVESTGSDLVVLFGLPTADERAAVADAARAALDALADASPASRTADPRIAILRASASLLRAAASTRDDIQRDARRAARTELASTIVLDPAASAAARLIISAAAEPDQADQALTDTLDLIADAEELGLDLAQRARAILTTIPLRAALGQPADQIQAALAPSMRQAPFAGVRSSIPDPYWAGLVAQARARAEIDRGSTPDPVAALDPLLEAIHAAPTIAEQDAAGLRTGLAVERLSARRARIDRVHPEAIHRYGLVLAPREGRFEDAISAFDIAAARFPPAAWDAGALLLERGDTIRAAAFFWRYAQAVAPSDPRRETAAALAVDHAPAPRRAKLAEAVRTFPDHPNASAWRLERAAETLGPDGLAALEGIPKGDPLRPQADRLALALLDRLGAEPGQNASTQDLKRAAELAEAAGDPAAPARWLKYAQTIAAADPAEASRITEDLLRRGGLTETDRQQTELLSARTAIATGDAAEAFTRLTTLLDRLDAAGDHRGPYWHAATLRLELLTNRPDPEARAAAYQHAVRLSTIDPELGGEPWRSRLRAIIQNKPAP